MPRTRLQQRLNAGTKFRDLGSQSKDKAFRSASNKEKSRRCKITRKGCEMPINSRLPPKKAPPESEHPPIAAPPFAVCPLSGAQYSCQPRASPPFREPPDLE